jgi:arylsulfatase A-like enzyme
MDRRRCWCVCLLLVLLPGWAIPARAEQVRPPNVVIIFTDDQGYGDLSCYGSAIATPNIDRMAREGTRFTSFYVAQAVCTASRAALLTGCYPNRIGLMGALGPNVRIGIHPQELTIAEMLKSRGYATAIYGKWHLGHHEQFLPTNHGFDEYYGLPYSNDMWPKHPTSKAYPDLPLIEGTKTIELNPDQRKLTTAYTDRAVSFIERNRETPFFLYLAHSMPHVPLFVSDRHAGKSGQELFGDVITEIDWSVGRVLDTIRKNGLDDRTLVIFTCDNGPWLAYGDHAGSAGNLREGKGTTFEGGVRVPFIARWPGKISAGTVCSEMAATIDVLPTLAKLTGEALPNERIIDGRDIWPLISAQPGAKTPHEAFYFYWGRDLQAVRSGKWKLHFPHAYRHVDVPGADGMPGKQSEQRIDLALFDLESDVRETTDVSAQHPEIVKRLEQLAAQARQDLGDGRMRGVGGREPGRVMD